MTVPYAWEDPRGSSVTNEVLNKDPQASTITNELPSKDPLQESETQNHPTSSMPQEPNSKHLEQFLCNEDPQGSFCDTTRKTEDPLMQNHNHKTDRFQKQDGLFTEEPSRVQDPVRQHEDLLEDSAKTTQEEPTTFFGRLKKFLANVLMKAITKLFFSASSEDRKPRSTQLLYPDCELDEDVSSCCSSELEREEEDAELEEFVRKKRAIKTVKSSSTSATTEAAKEGSGTRASETSTGPTTVSNFSETSPNTHSNTKIDEISTALSSTSTSTTTENTRKRSGSWLLRGVMPAAANQYAKVRARRNKKFSSPTKKVLARQIAAFHQGEALRTRGPFAAQNVNKGRTSYRHKKAILDNDCRRYTGMGLRTSDLMANMRVASEGHRVAQRKGRMF
jgi:hypothetical protein